jgi:5-methyltetrahydrofolate--homocysteine methyltransferase
MLIIGEKINGTRRSVGQAVLQHDGDFIRKLAKDQVEAGADYLDVNAGTGPERDFEDLAWLVQMVQEVVDTPLCIDSPNPRAMAFALRHVKTRPILNSISGEEERLRSVLPLAVEHKAKVIALAMDGSGIPKDVEARLGVIRRLMDELGRAGVADDDVFVDPLAIAIATDNRGALIACETIRSVHAEYPAVHFTCGLSNISFGMPARALVNRGFLTLMMEAGLDSAIMDPMDRCLIETLFASEALLAKDRNCLRFNRAFRAGRIGAKPVEALP